MRSRRRNRIIVNEVGVTVYLILSNILAPLQPEYALFDMMVYVVLEHLAIIYPIAILQFGFLPSLYTHYCNFYNSKTLFIYIVVFQLLEALIGNPAFYKCCPLVVVIKLVCYVYFQWLSIIILQPVELGLFFILVTCFHSSSDFQYYL